MHIGIFLGILVSWSDSLQVFTSTDRQVLLLYRLHMIIDLRDAYNYSGHYYSTGGPDEENHSGVIYAQGDLQPPSSGVICVLSGYQHPSAMQ